MKRSCKRRCLPHPTGVNGQTPVAFVIKIGFPVCSIYLFIYLFIYQQRSCKGHIHLLMSPGVNATNSSCENKRGVSRRHQLHEDMPLVGAERHGASRPFSMQLVGFFV
jgi:hypothetical protein